MNRDQLFALCRTLGEDPNDVTEIRITPSHVIVTVTLRQGEKRSAFVDPKTGDLAVRHAVHEVTR